ncbi:MAG: hypothetical protein CMJ89_03965 [Planctomycetes bacterium]|nr:hypothetical protein [Planctomycetota bacterium]
MKFGSCLLCVPCAVMALCCYTGCRNGAPWTDDGSVSFEFSAPFASELNSEGVEVAEIQVGAGFLKIIGEENRHKISLEGTKAADSEATLNEISIVSLATAATAIITVDGPESSDKRYKVDLTLFVPRPMALKVSDTSGSIEISGIRGNIAIKDGSGGIQIKNTEGNVDIDDGSGSIQLADLKGDDLRVTDGSGSISLLNASCSVAQIEDGSGSITVNGMQGNLTISDGSGSIDVRTVQGNVTVTRAGSGDVDITDVTGTVKTPRD